MSNPITDLSTALSAAIEVAAPSVVHVATSHRRTSGTVWSPDLVITAAHRVRTDEARVRLHDGTERTASVVGRDLATDVAVIKVEGGGLSPITFGDASAVKVGQLSLALGRPGRGVRASLRIVGVVGDDVPTRAGARLSRWIETDRGLPEGFSGGPLIDGEGKALGLSTDGLVRGADLAIPRADLERAINEISSHGHVRRGWLGVAVNAVRLPQKVADQLSQKSGALVTGVEDGGPADRAGLVLGDVIHAIDGTPVRGPEDLVGVLRARIDVEITISIVRAGQLEQRKVTTVAKAA